MARHQLAQEEAMESLSTIEQELHTKIDRVEFHGKRGRNVAVLFTDKFKEQRKVLNKNLPTGGIDYKKMASLSKGQ